MPEAEKQKEPTKAEKRELAQAADNKRFADQIQAATAQRSGALDRSNYDQ